VFEPSVGSDPRATQLHDLNPSAAPPLGLFWTVEMPADAVTVDLDRGTGTLQATNVPILDFGDIPNALSGSRPPVPGTVSFRVQWTAAAALAPIRNADPVYGRYAGDFARATAQMDWSARVGPYEFRSAAMETSTSEFGLLGRERNGMFFA
jgi:hypothetical protein